jgi:hypothetical protein
MKPRLSSSCDVFEQRGDPWLTDRERDKEYPLRQSVSGDEPDEHSKALAKTRQKIAARSKGSGSPLDKALDALALGYSPRPSIIINPDMDCHTKAEKAQAKPRFVDPPRQKTEASFERKLAATRLKINKRFAARKPIEYREEPRVVKVKGSFYRFEDSVAYGRVERVKK